jgi:hypothetical protein
MPEQIGIVLIFLVVILFNLITGLLNRRRERAAVEQEKKVPQPAPRPPRAAPARLAMAPPRIDVSPPAPPPTPTYLRRGHVKLTGGDLRRAIVVMTLLGSPRALEHQERRMP